MKTDLDKLILKTDRCIDAVLTFNGRPDTAFNRLGLMERCNRAQKYIFELEDNFKYIHRHYDSFCDLSNIFSILK